MTLEKRYRNAVEETQLEMFPLPERRRFTWLERLLAILCVLLALGLSVAAYAEEKLDRRLLRYIEEHTGMPTEHIVPRYEYWTPEKLNQVYYGEHYSGQRNVLALTIGGRIILPYFFDETAQEEVLLHELFHLAVFENGVQYQCIGEEERFAYALQDKFVEERGWGMKSDPFMVFMMQCHHLIPR